MQRNGPYKDLNDFASRMDTKAMNKRQFDGLICAGAFDSFGHTRAELYGNMELILRHAGKMAEERESGQSSLFGGGGADGIGGDDLPPFAQVELWDSLETLSREFGAVGFYLSAHPLDARMGQLEKMGVVPFTGVEDKLSRSSSSRLQMAGILIRKQERVSAKSGNKFAFLQLSDATGVYEVMIFSDTLARSREFLEPGTALLVNVDAQTQNEELRFTGQQIEPLDQALAGKVKEMTIHVDAAAAVEQLHTQLEHAGRGAVKIHLIAHIDGHEAAFDLKGRYQIPPDMISTLQKTPGFVKYSEG